MSEVKKDGRGGARVGAGRPKSKVGEGSTMMRVPLGLVDVVKQLSHIYREQQREIRRLNE